MVCGCIKTLWVKVSLSWIWHPTQGEDAQMLRKSLYHDYDSAEKKHSCKKSLINNLRAHLTQCDSLANAEITRWGKTGLFKKPHRKTNKAKVKAIKQHAGSDVKFWCIQWDKRCLSQTGLCDHPGMTQSLPPEHWHCRTLGIRRDL